MYVPVIYNACKCTCNILCRGHPSKCIQLHTNIDAYKCSFYPSVIRLWNALPNHVTEANSLNEFQSLLSS